MSRKRKPLKTPVMPEMCKTCPFRDDAPENFKELRPMLTASALTEASRICHSTGSGNAINHRTGKSPMLCRGARNVQLEHWHRLGFIESPTDEAWERKRKELGC